jgi:predicted GIY-YIG superfamily endonuclease/ribonuclease HI
MRHNYSLITDASLNPEHSVGVGGYLIAPEALITDPSSAIRKCELSQILVLRRFEGTSSAKLEVQTVLWALEECCAGSTIPGSGNIHIYTDSQCVAGLLSRRRRLENSGYQCRGGKRQLKNASLYRKYYEFYDRLAFEVTQVAGHAPSRSRNRVQSIFSFVDQSARKALKLWMAQLEADRPEWSLYMIRCPDGSLYTGISTDVARRFENHQKMGKQGAKYLRGKSPLKLVFQKKIGSKSLALKMEHKIKKLTKSQKEILIHTRDIDQYPSS